MPIAVAFRRIASSARFIAFATLATGDFAFYEVRRFRLG
jgi:hypothetical protein